VEFYRSDASWPGAFNDNRRMFARLSAFVIWSLVAATAVFWVFRFTARSPQAPAYAVAVGKSAPLRGDLSRLFGAAPLVAATPEAAPEAPSRFKLVGVMAPRSSTAEAPGTYGLALIAVDGKPAKAFAVGSPLDNDLVLQSVGLRTASIGPAQGARSVLLEIPALPAAATGVLPGPGAAPATPAPAPVAPAAPAMRMLPPPASATTAPAPVPAIGAVPAPAMQPAPPPAAPAPNPIMPTPDNFRSQ
jgi:general secretion pathway protein C